MTAAAPSSYQLRKQCERRKFNLIHEEKCVAVVVPAGDDVKTRFAMSLASMMQYTVLAQPDGLSQMALQSFSSSILPFSRQQLALSAMKLGATHTLWIDSDMEFPRDMLVRFLKHDEKIIGINATSRHPPYRNTAQPRPEEPLTTNLDSSGLEKVHRMGFGVMWIATEVFKSMELPYFDFEYVPEKQCWRGEDYAFFEKARAAGHDFYVDHDLSKEIFHLGTMGFNPLMLDKMERSQE